METHQHNHLHQYTDAATRKHLDRIEWMLLRQDVWIQAIYDKLVAVQTPTIDEEKLRELTAKLGETSDKLSGALTQPPTTE